MPTLPSTLRPWDDTRATARRVLLRVLRRDFLEPVRLNAPLPRGAFDRLTLAADDYLNGAGDHAA